MFFQDDTGASSAGGDVSQKTEPLTTAGDPADQALVGQVLDGAYHLTDLMVCGGYGAVYEAREARLGKRVAVKVLRQARIDELEAYEFFRREAEVLGRMAGHPGIVALLDQGRTTEQESRPYLVLEFLDGWPLCVVTGAQQRLAVRSEVWSSRILTAIPKQLPVEAAVWIVCQVCRGLEALHGADIIWRDCKPENVFLCIPAQGPARIKLFDFGLAIPDKELWGNSQRSDAYGTPAYMSPEQASGVSIDKRSDIYSLGVLLYQLLTDQVPLDGDGPIEIMTKVVFSAPLPIQKRRNDLPPDLAPVVMTALAKNRADRFSTAAEFREWLELCVPQAAGDLPPPALAPIVEALKL